MIVYLTGGFRGDWHQQVIEQCPQFTFQQSVKYGVYDASKYILKELEMIKSSDVIFVYLESGSRDSHSLSLEIGYAKALGKSIILVDEKSSINFEFWQDWDMCRYACDSIFMTLEEGINYLRGIHNTY